MAGGKRRKSRKSQKSRRSHRQRCGSDLEFEAKARADGEGAQRRGIQCCPCAVVAICLLQMAAIDFAQPCSRHRPEPKLGCVERHNLNWAALLLRTNQKRRS